MTDAIIRNSRLARLALELSAYPPPRRGKMTDRAYVLWDDLEKLRAELSRLHAGVEQRNIDEGRL